MSAITDAAAAMNLLTGQYAGTREEMVDFLITPADGGPDLDGYVLMTVSEGVQVKRPSLAKLLSVVGGTQGRLYASYVDLAATVGETYGQMATVAPEDVGTHTEPGGGAPVANAGYYVWTDAAPDYWKRVGNLIAADVAAALAGAEAARDQILLNAGFIDVAADLAGSNNIGAVAAALVAINTAAANIADIQAAANLVAQAPLTISQPRRLTADDDNRVLLVNFEGPGALALHEITVPSDSVEDLPNGTKFELLRNGGTGVVRIVGDGNGVTVTPVIPTENALTATGQRCFVLKVGPNNWSLYAASTAIGNGADAHTVRVWLDWSDLSTMKQERTGAAATTAVAVGDPVGSIRNKGTDGGWATARADNRRPILRQDATGRYYIETDGSNDFLELNGLLIDLTKLNLYVGFKALSYGYARGIVSLAPFDASGDGANDRFVLAQNALNPIPSDYTIQMGASGVNRLAASIAGAQPKRPHVFEWRKTANATPATVTVDGFEITHTGPLGLAALGTVTALETATLRLIIGANPGNEGQGGAIQFSNTAFYSLVLTDAVLNAAQRRALRAYVEDKSYPTPPVLSSIADLIALAAARTTLQTEVFGGAVPTDVASKATDSSPPVTGLTNLASVQKLTIPGEADVKIKPRLWTPNAPRSNVVALIWAGHAAGWNANGIRDFALQPLLTAGVRVVTMVLPDGPNDYTSGDPSAHGANQTAYVKWARQAWVAVNTLLADAPGAQVIMTGISGGGHATQFCAALDPRITKAIPFVGTIPDYFYLNVDYEQWNTQISANTLDTYLLAAAGGRRFIHVLHEGDEAGFNRAVYDSRPTWITGLAAQAAALGGGYYELRWFNHSLHALTANSTNTLLAELP